MDAPKPSLITITGDIKKCDEFYNIRDYYMKLFYTSNDELNIICYNMELLDGIKYQLKIELQNIYNLSNIFRQYTNMKDLYEYFIDLINEGKYELLKNKDNNLTLNLVISDIKKNDHKISFVLIHENNNNTQEYINILSTEIKNMKSINNNYITEIKQLKEENQDIKNEIKEIKSLLLKYEINLEKNKNDNKEIILKTANNINNKKNEPTKNKNANNELLEKICSLCRSNTNLKKCICNKIYCENCIFNNKIGSCKEQCFLLNNNLNKLNSLYNISKYPLPKNFEAKIHFSEVEMVRIGITFDPNIVNEKKDKNMPQYRIYYILQDLNDFYSYHEKKWKRYFGGRNRLKNGDDLTIILNNGKLKYLINGDDLGKEYTINNRDLDEENMYLLIHRRNQYSQCELKYIYEII